jgi:hypothetical protein
VRKTVKKIAEQIHKLRVVTGRFLLSVLVALLVRAAFVAAQVELHLLNQVLVLVEEASLVGHLAELFDCDVNPPAERWATVEADVQPRVDEGAVDLLREQALTWSAQGQINQLEA